MKTKNLLFAFEQVALLATCNYLLLIQDGFIFKTPWKASFGLALLYLHTGAFAALVYTLFSKQTLVRIKALLNDFITFLYASFVSLCCFHNLLHKNQHSLLFYALALFTLFTSLLFLHFTYTKYHDKYNTSSLPIKN